jgi:hypothetical protein
MWEEIFSGKYVWDGVKYKMPHPLNKKREGSENIHEIKK